MTTTAYIAGLFDGEGCILINKRFVGGRPYHRLNVYIGMTDSIALRAVAKKIPGGVMYLEPRKYPNKSIYRLLYSGNRAAEFLKKLLPHLLLKKKQAMVALRFQKRNEHRRPGGTILKRISSRVERANERDYRRLQKLKTVKLH